MNRREHRLVEFIWSFPIQPPVKDLTYLNAGRSEVDVVLFIGRRVLIIVNRSPMSQDGGETYFDCGQKGVD
jgi:hypothetical protein